jgi:hypothetical protein
VVGFEPIETATVPESNHTDHANGGIKGKRPSKNDKLRAAKSQN